MYRLRMSREPPLACADADTQHDSANDGWRIWLFAGSDCLWIEIERARGVATVYGHVPIDALMNRTDPLIALSGTAKMVVGKCPCMANATANPSAQVGGLRK